jgi:hypothetical protein
MPRVPAALVAASGRASTGAGGGDGERAGGRAGAARAAGGRAACAPGGSESRGGWGVGSAPGGRWEERGFCTTGTDAESAGGWLVFPRFHMEPPASAPSTPKSARQSANHPTFFCYKSECKFSFLVLRSFRTINAKYPFSDGKNSYK